MSSEEPGAGYTRLQWVWMRMRQTAVNVLYSLIQPRQVPPEPKEPPGLRIEILIAVLGLIGWVVFFLYYDQVSPVAAVDLQHDRGEIFQIAEDYARARGLEVAGYHHAMSFGSDAMAQIYLEQTVGVPRMSQLVRDKEVPVWRWYVRWFVPQQHEEVRVYLLPTGEVVGFSHILPEDAFRPVVTVEEAQGLAESYLSQDRGLTLSDWELYDVSTQTLSNRTDHSLTWVKRGLEIGDGDVRILVKVQGDEVGRFDTWFRVPEAFARAYREQRSQAGLLDTLATGCSWVFVLGGAFVLLWGLYSGLKIGWAPVLVGLVAGAVDLVDSFNSLPAVGLGYDTAVDYGTYLLNRLGAYLDSAAYNALLVAFLVVASRWLLRAVWPRQHKLIPDARDRWGGFARSSWRGVMLGGLMAAYLIVFYVVADLLGAWSPVGTPAVDLLATPFPFVHAIWLGLLPALGEELKYRALGIGLMMRVTRGRAFLALLVPALLWGFAHSSYLTDPIWLRGVELTLSSLLLTGLFFLLFDITTSVVAHYTYNASLIAIILMRSGQPAFVVTGLAAFLLGLVPGLIILVRRLTDRRGEEVPVVALSVGCEEAWEAIRAQGGGWPEEWNVPRQLVCLSSGDGQLVGYAAGAIMTDTAEGGIGTVLDIFVDEPYRGRYYGTTLYRALVEWFDEQGVVQVQAQVPIGPAGSSTFWTVQGFRPGARVWRKRLV